MDELLNRALQGVDPNASGAYWLVFANLMALVPWRALAWWNVLFVLVGAALGVWRGHWRDGVLWALVLGPVGWLVLLWRTRPRHPPPLPPHRRKS